MEEDLFVKKAKFGQLKIGDIFECWGDYLINYSSPVVCRCVKLEEEVAEEIGGMRFLVSKESEVFIC